MTSDAPYITDFYMNCGFKNIFTLYHWYRKVTPTLENLGNKRILLSKHMQLLWSNIGDLFATVVEGKFYKEAREVFALVTEKHKSDNDFLSSIYYHICSEVFKQEDIITYFLTHSKFFLECLIDIMKMLITEDFGEAVPQANRRPYLAARYGQAGRPAVQREFDDQTISQITDIGFSRRLATDALNRTQGNIELAIEYLLSLPSNVVEDFNNEDAKSPVANEDAKMDSEEKKDQDDDMDVDDSGIVVCNKVDLAKAIKQWLKMLFNWVLQGFNSTLTDIDVDNITNFILKYISTEEDVQVLMKHLIQSLNEMNEFLCDTEKDISDINYQKTRNSCIKKASTLSKILSFLSKYFLTNVRFMEKLIG